MKRVLFYCAIAAISFTACKKTTTPAPTPAAPTTITGTKIISVAFDPMGMANFTLFRFSDSSIVANADSASSNWDFGLRFTTFIVNSNAGGPGSAGAILADGTFDAATTAPSTGYAYDTTTSARAIKDGSWYTYNATTHAFTPNAGKVFFFKTADGLHYAKMELLAVDYGPLVGNPPSPSILYYTFRYTYQSNGTTTF